MNKIVLAFSTLLLTACAVQPMSPVQGNIAPPQVQNLNAQRNTLTAQSALPIALENIKQLDPNAQLFEIDVWQEATGKSLHYGFISSLQEQAFKVIINAETQEAHIEDAPQQNKALINRAHWKLDNTQIYARAQQYGLRDQTYLATLWEDTWHISGLKQDLYFQMDAQNGAIKLRCIGPYLNNCTGDDGQPVQRVQDQGLQAHLLVRQKSK